jgi:sortase A
MTAGVVILLFVAYQLWGTGLAEHKAQRHLKRTFAAAGTVGVPAKVTAPGTPTTTAVAPPPTPTGEAVALLKIPKIGLDVAVVQGVGLPDLRKGPGHYPKSPLPGEPGNAAIAGHRTTYGAPFYRLDELKPGDPLLVTTRAGKFQYEVAGSKVVSPTAREVLNPTPDNRLTLTTCNPRFSAKQRLIVWAELKGTAVEPPPPPPPAAVSDTTVAPVSIDEDPGVNLGGATEARVPAALWGWAALTVWITVRLLGAKRRWRRLAVYAPALPVALIFLFFFFENVARLLPANI